MTRRPAARSRESLETTRRAPAGTVICAMCGRSCFAGSASCQHCGSVFSWSWVLDPGGQLVDGVVMPRRAAVHEVPEAEIPVEVVAPAPRATVRGVAILLIVFVLGFGAAGIAVHFGVL